jgi:hypothetical protein
MVAILGLQSTPWIRAFDEMCQIIGWREHHYPLSNLLREVPKIPRYQPGAGGMRQRKEWHVCRVWPTMRPATWIR